MRKPKVFLFDEPLSNLDAALRVDMRMEISELHKDLDATMIYVTHDQVEAMTLADRRATRRRGDAGGQPTGTLPQPGQPVRRGLPRSPKMNFLEVDVKQAADGRVTVASLVLEPVAIPYAAGAFQAGGRAVLVVRPQFLHPGEGAYRGHLHGRVSLVGRLGTETVLNVELTRGGRIVVALDGDRPFDVGAEMLVGFEPKRAHLFPAA